METHTKKSGSQILCADDACVPTGKCKCTATKQVTATCTSATDKWVQDADFKAKCIEGDNCVDSLSAHNISALGATQGWTTATSGLCSALGNGNCRKTDKTVEALSGLKVKKSITDGTCVATCADTSCKQTSTGAQIDIGTNSWTGADDATCAAVSATNCRTTTKLSIAFADNKTGQKSSTDAACTVAASTQCRNTTSGKLEAFGTKAWTGANDYKCVGVKSNLNCRSASSQLSIPFANTKTGWASNTDAACTTAPGTKCKDASVGFLQAAGTNSWTSANNAICAAVTKSTNCRNASTGVTEAWGTKIQGWKSANDAECEVITDRTKCRNSTSVMEAIGVKAWTTTTNGLCAALTKINCRVSATGIARANSTATTKEGQTSNVNGVCVT